MNNFVILTVAGKQYGGWKSVRIGAGIERLSRDFELSVTDKWPGSTSQVRRIQPGDLCEVRIGNDLVCTGYVDATPVDYDAGSITIMIRGRSKTADLVDCSADNSGGQFRQANAAEVARKLAGQYGIEVVEEAAAGSAMVEHQIKPGETAFESLDRVARARQVLLTDNAEGALVIASPGSAGRASDALVLGENVLSASAGFDFSEVYSQYVAKGQVGRAGNDADFGDDSAAIAAQQRGQASDNSIKRRRVLIVRQSGHADSATCQQRADYEQRVRSAKANEIRYRVQGWRQRNGELWRPNLRVSVRDGLMAVNGTRLISEVVYTLDDGGTVAELVTVPPDAFATEPDNRAKAADRRQGAVAGSSSRWDGEE